MLEAIVNEFVSEQVHEQAPQVNAWDSSSPSFHSNAIPTGLRSQILWGLLFLALVSQVGGPGAGLGKLHS